MRTDSGGRCRLTARRSVLGSFGVEGGGRDRGRGGRTSRLHGRIDRLDGRFDMLECSMLSAMHREFNGLVLKIFALAMALVSAVAAFAVPLLTLT